MSTAFGFAIDSRQMNLLLVGIMGTIPLFLLVQFPYLKKSENSIYFLIFSILISSLYHFGSFRLSSLLYTLMYLLTFIYYIRLISTLPLKIDRYIKLLKFILYAYFIVLLIQQFCLLAGSPYIPNFILGDTAIYKLNALAPEPSHTARIILVLMYSYLCMFEIKVGRPYQLIKDVKNNPLLWFAFLYAMLTMGSGFAIVLLLVFFIQFFSLKRIYYLLPLLILPLILVINLDLPAVERVLKFGDAFFKLDPQSMIKADHSASIRVVPTFIYLRLFDFRNFNTWLGFGTDYTTNLIPTLMPGIVESGYHGGLFPTFFMDRGLVCAIILFMVIYKYCIRKLFSFNTFLLLLLIFASGINTQIFWISILLYTTNKYFYTAHFKPATTNSDYEQTSSDHGDDFLPSFEMD